MTVRRQTNQHGTDVNSRRQERQQRLQVNNVIDCCVCGELTPRPPTAELWAMITCPGCQLAPQAAWGPPQPSRQNAAISPAPVNENEVNPTGFAQVPMTHRWLND